MQIDLRFDAATAVDFLDRKVAKQIPFATALALTRTAGAVQDQLRESLPRHFTIRSNWASKGIQTRRATKSSLIAEVGTRDAFMERQIFGGTKTSIDGGLVSVPRQIRRTPKQKTTRARWPGAMLRKPNVFAAELPSGDVGIFQRMRKGLKLLYVMTDHVEVEPRWPFFDIAWETVAREWPYQQVKALIQAIKTAR